MEWRIRLRTSADEDKTKKIHQLTVLSVFFLSYTSSPELLPQCKFCPNVNEDPLHPFLLSLFQDKKTSWDILSEISSQSQRFLLYPACYTISALLWLFFCSQRHFEVASTVKRNRTMVYLRQTVNQQRVGWATPASKRGGQNRSFCQFYRMWYVCPRTKRCFETT